ncbi:hypothetical protein ABZY06_07025 [Streptomyces sp. NPDC006540]|jgi:hypothetical protein|uniref:hypothetical protein n=1 Tax=Streptomyces sp. NPDC006540 TaxID=3155353 RepID=UPI0033A48948
MPVSAAADRVWTCFPAPAWPLPTARLVATDTHWARGAGDEARAPVSVLLMLLTGRARHLLPPARPGEREASRRP